jgi:hypothetical protein
LGHWLWASDQAGLAESSPATQVGWVQPSHMGRVGPSPKNKNKIQKNSFQKSVIFRKYFTAF